MALFTSTDITADTLEGAMLQLAQLLQSAEQEYTPAEGVARQNRVQLTVNTDTAVATIAVTLPLLVDVGASGAISITAEEYAVDAP